MTRCTRLGKAKGGYSGNTFWQFRQRKRTRQDGMTFDEELVELQIEHAQKEFISTAWL